MERHATGIPAAHPALRHSGLLAPPVSEAPNRLGPEWAGRVGVAAIDPAPAVTAEFCARCGVDLDLSADSRCAG